MTWQYLRPSYLGPSNLKIFNNMNYKAWRYQSSVVGTPMILKFILHIYFNFKIVRGIQYYQMLDPYVSSEAQNSKNVVFLQYGAPHTTRSIISLLDEVFPFRDWKVESNSWRERSPNLTTLELFQSGFVKDQFYRTSGSSLAQIRRGVTRAIRTDSQKYLSNV